MRTGEQGSFRQGAQVFNCYGRLNNTDLLIDYGFALLPNRYDSVYVRLYRSRMEQIEGRPTIIKPDITINRSLKDSMEVYYLKYN